MHLSLIQIKTSRHHRYRVRLLLHSPSNRRTRFRLAHSAATVALSLAGGDGGGRFGPVASLPLREEEGTWPLTEKKAAAILCARLTALEGSLGSGGVWWVAGRATRATGGSGERAHRPRVSRRARLLEKGRGSRGGGGLNAVNYFSPGLAYLVRWLSGYKCGWGEPCKQDIFFKILRFRMFQASYCRYNNPVR